MSDTEANTPNSPPSTGVTTPPAKTQQASMFSSLGGRKFLLVVCAIAAILIGSLPFVSMDHDTKQLIVYLALGGAGSIAIENALGKKRE